MKFTIAAAVLLISGGSVFAQTSPPARSDAQTPAVATPTTQNPGAPVAGANSFTEGQAKSRIEGAGFGNVSSLMKDKDGVWRAKAMKGGTSYDVAVDFQGNVTPR